MPYRLLRNESVEESLRRIAREQIDAALEEIDCALLEGDGSARDDAIHQVRKRCKKIRGLLRLVRPALEIDYRLENAHYRDAAEILSTARDSAAVIEVHDALVRRYASQTKPTTSRRAAEAPQRGQEFVESRAAHGYSGIPFVERTEMRIVTRDAVQFAGMRRMTAGNSLPRESGFETIRRALVERHHEPSATGIDTDARIADFRSRMIAGRKRVSSWTLRKVGFSSIRGGLRETYALGHDFLRAARENPSEDTLHEWRKHVKYQWYHARLIQSLWPPVMKQRRHELKKLSEWLGDEHDLARLALVLNEERFRLINEPGLVTYLHLVDKHRQALRSRSLKLGARIFAEKPVSMTKRFECYWRVWRG